MAIIDRLAQLYERRLDLQSRIASKPKPSDYDETGNATIAHLSTERFLGVAEFVLHGNVASFKSRLSRSARLRLSLHERASRGEPIDPSYLSMLGYKQLLDGLAAGDFPTARALANHLGARPEIVAKYDHYFDKAMGYALKAFTAGAQPEMERFAAEFAAVCERRGKADFRGYSVLFNAILARDSTLANEGMQLIVQGHQRQSRRVYGVFYGSEDEVLSVWGIGVANLALSNDLDVSAIPPLIPSELLVR